MTIVEFIGILCMAVGGASGLAIFGSKKGEDRFLLGISALFLILLGARLYW